MPTIRISNPVYRRLQDQAARLQLSVDQVVDRLLDLDPIEDVDPHPEADLPMPAAGSDEALAAAARLTCLFADLSLPDLDLSLADPRIALANAGIVDPA